VVVDGEKVGGVMGYHAIHFGVPFILATAWWGMCKTYAEHTLRLAGPTATAGPTTQQWLEATVTSHKWLHFNISDGTLFPYFRFSSSNYHSS